MSGSPDPVILAWAAADGRVVLTYDASTMVRFALDRVGAGEPMPGLVLVLKKISLGTAVADLELLLLAGDDAFFRDRVIYLPLR